MELGKIGSCKINFRCDEEPTFVSFSVKLWNAISVDIWIAGGITNLMDDSTSLSISMSSLSLSSSFETDFAGAFFGIFVDFVISNKL